jgi:hypothetical protein
MKSRIIAVTLVLSLAALSPAPIRDLRSGVKVQPERSQEQVTRDQSEHQMTRAEVAPPPKDTEETYIQKESLHDRDAANTVAGSLNEDAIAKKALEQAEKDIHTKEPRNWTWLWGLFIALFGFGVVFALKHFVGKSIPDMPGGPPRGGPNGSW